MKYGKQKRAAVALAALVSLYGCGSGDETSITLQGGGTVDPGGSTPGGISLNCPSWSSARSQINGKDVCQLPSQILQDRVLTNNIIWFMADRVTVGNGNREMSATEGVLLNGGNVANVLLTIEAGTEVVGQKGTFANLIITRGSRINAIGTAAEPIIFSSDDAGYDGTGEWGGLIIHGYGLHNECPVDVALACNIDSEGESGFAAGRSADDDSGRLSYVVVTEGGYEFAPGNEINGISLVGVGSKTEMDHIQINSNSDDGMEFYGGSVNVKYLVLTGNLDDSVDWDEGFQGNLQYVLVVQSGATAGNAIEADTEGTTLFNSKPTIANATFIGDGTNDTLWVFKKSSGGFLLNTVGTVASANATIVNCVNVDGAGAEANIVAGELALSNVIADCQSFGIDAGDATLGASGLVVPGSALNLDVNYAITNAIATAKPLDVATFNVSYPGSTADPDFLDDTDYIGAVDPSASAPFWFENWTLEGTL